MSGSRTIGKYEIQAVVGKGPHATVYRATHPGIQHSVAIKVFPPDVLESRALEPFRKYAAGLARVRHPYIAGFIELVEQDGHFCLVSRFVEGTPLSSLLKNGAYPDPKRAWDIIRHILEALGHAHQQGAVHRDLKPSNVLLGADGHLALTDLGTSMLRATRSDPCEYLSPEHFHGEKLTARSDIYQAGVLAYQLVTGKLPFTGTVEELAHRIAEERPSDPSSYNHQLAWQLDWVIQKALSKDPADRFANAFDFGEGVRLGLQDTIGRPLPGLVKVPTAAAAQSAPPMPAPAAKPAPPAPAPAAKAAAPVAAPSKPAAAPPAPAPPKPMVAPLEPPKPAAPKIAPVPPEEATIALPLPKAAAPAVPPQLLENAKILAKAASPAPPPAPVDIAAANEPAQAAGDPAKSSILFVDDDPRILNSLRSLFRQDYNVHIAESGEAALKIIATTRVQVVVSDQRMPGMLGVDLLRQVKLMAPTAVRLLLTGYTDLASLVGSINHGEIFRFVMKPWDNEELRQAVTDAMRESAQLSAAQPAKPAAARSAGSLLVIDRNEAMARGLQRLLSGAARVIRVETPAEAAKVLSREEVAAVVADMGSGMDGLVALFRELRAKLPGVLSILLTDEPDSDLAIELINRAQIFRLLPKPVNARDLRTQVAEALRRYSVYKQRAAAASGGNRGGALGGRSVAGAA